MSSFKKQNLIIIGLLILLSIPSIIPLFHKGFFVTDDGEWMIIRLSDFYTTLKSGQLPVRFLGRLNYGYGYPVATFLYPGIMYLGSLIHIFKIGYISSIKIILGMSLVGSAVISYLWLSKSFNKVASLVGALFYLYLPYHMYDAYKRGSIGEIFALLWVPFILWMIDKKNAPLTSVGIFLLIISHNSLAVLFLPLLFVYAIFRNPKTKFVTTISFVLGFMLSSFYIIPAVFELKYTNFSATKVASPLEYFADYKLIGLSALVVVMLGVLLLIKKRTEIKNKSIAILFIAMSILTIFFSTIYSSFLWQILPSSFIQFPFRLLSLLLPSCAFLSALIVSSSGRYKWFLVLTALVILAYSSFTFLSPKEYTDKGEGFYSTNDATTTVKDEYMPLWVKKKPLKRSDRKIEITKGIGNMQNVKTNNKSVSFDIDLRTRSVVQINTLYWPGFNASIDEKQVPILYNNSRGLITLNTPQGKHSVSIKFDETPLRMVSDFISVFTLLMLGLVFIKNIKYEKS